MSRDVPQDLQHRFEELGDVDPDAVASAAAELAATPAHDLVYYGIRAEKAFAELADRVSETAHSATVRDASSVLAEMLAVLRDFSPGKSSGGWWRRLIGRGDENLQDAYQAVGAKLDGLAARLEGFSNPLLAEAITLERFEAAVADALAAVDAHLKAGLLHLPKLKGTEAFRDLLLRLEDMFTARAVAGQNLATIALLADNRRQLAERTEFLLDRALPLWHRQAEAAMELHDQLAGGKPLETTGEDSSAAPSEIAPVRERVAAAPDSLASVLDDINRRLAEALHADGQEP